MQAKQTRSDILYMTTLDTGRCSHIVSYSFILYCTIILYILCYCIALYYITYICISRSLLVWVSTLDRPSTLKPLLGLRAYKRRQVGPGGCGESSKRPQKHKDPNMVYSMVYSRMVCYNGNIRISDSGFRRVCYLIV